MGEDFHLHKKFDTPSLLYYLPSIEEQQKIGSFFKQLDDTIISLFISVSLKNSKNLKKVSTKDVLLILNLIKFRIL